MEINNIAKEYSQYYSKSYLQCQMVIDIKAFIL